MKGYSLLVTLCIGSLAVCNDQLIMRVLDETPSAPHSVELISRFTSHGLRGLRGHDIVRKDQRRVEHLLGNKPKEVPMIDAFTAVLINVTVGDGNYTLIVDTGSSNTWVGANQTNPYLPSKASFDTRQDVNVTYGSGNFTGHQFTDIMKVPGISKEFIQSFGSANSSFGFDGADGIFGIGPLILTNGTLHPNLNELIPTVTDNLFSHHIIKRNMTALFVPPVATNNPRADFGGINTEGLTSKISFVPLTKVPRVDQFWAANQSITFGEGRHEVTLSKEGQGIFDVGTTLLLLETSAFKSYTKLVGAVLDNDTGLLRVDDLSRLKSMFFHIGDRKYEFTPDAQKLPRLLNVPLGGVENATYLNIGDVGDIGVPHVSLNGLSWLQRVYSVFDGDKAAMGFAHTNFTHAIVNG